MSLSLILTFGFLLIALPGPPAQKDHDMGGMPGMNVGNDMSNKDEMRDMGPSMTAMAGHMIITPLRPKQPGDEEKAKAAVAEAKATMERYEDYRKALADGYVLAHPDVNQSQYHFIHKANGEAPDTHFDPAKPSALLYRRTKYQLYKIEGVMYTAKVGETEDELNNRIPLSIARWHQHVNFCAAPADRTNEYFGARPTFGMFGSIKTKEACDAARGVFYPFMFNWMIHVFPDEKNFKDVFSMNDDIAHAH